MSFRRDWSVFGLNVVLVEPEIPPNTGNIGRLCAGIGAALHLVGKLGFSTDDRALKRAGLDYWRQLSIHFHDDMESLRSGVPRDRFHYVTTRTGRLYTAARYAPGDFLVFGSESRGLPDAVIQESEDRLITIPMNGAVRSLNLSNAAAVVVYEALRQLSSGFTTLPPHRKA